jgi:hypothetical protein
MPALPRLRAGGHLVGGTGERSFPLGSRGDPKQK